MKKDTVRHRCNVISFHPSLLGALSEERSVASVTISGVGGEVYSPFQVEFSLQSLKSAKHTIIRANVVDKIPECQTIGQAPPPRELSEFQSLDLSDPGYNFNSRIDVLFG